LIDTTSNRGIAGIGGYAPLLRLDKAAAARALRFAGLGGRGGGHRAVASWDEDAVTLAVEAGRIALNRSTPDRVIFASTSAPFFERCHASVLVDALGLPQTLRSTDVAGTRRCGTSAMLDALLGHGSALIAAGEKRNASAGSPFHTSFGDGGAAVLVSDNAPTRIVGHASLSHDLVDVYASREHPHPYGFEERFVKESAVKAMLAPTIKAALADAGVQPDDISHLAIIEPLAGMTKDILKATGLSAPNHAADLNSQVGDLGAAHPLFALALAFDAATPGDKVLLAGFGSGCDVVVFELHAPVPGAAETAAMLKRGLTFDDYVRFLSLTDALELDWGVRSEFEQKAQATVLERHSRDTIGFIGGKDEAGNVQFPKSRIPVRPDAQGAERLEDVRLADLEGTLLSVTADRLNFTPDPPFWFGLVQFDNGARVMMELTDADAKGFAVGDRLTMRLRIKSHDRRRGFRTWFWKAAPVVRPSLEG
jgi:hydroxymethylglutaryl-CoA synthase